MYLSWRDIESVRLHHDSHKEFEILPRGPSSADVDLHNICISSKTIFVKWFCCAITNNFPQNFPVAPCISFCPVIIICPANSGGIISRCLKHCHFSVNLTVSPIILYSRVGRLPLRSPVVACHSLTQLTHINLCQLFLLGSFSPW